MAARSSQAPLDPARFSPSSTGGHSECIPAFAADLCSCTCSAISWPERKGINIAVKIRFDCNLVSFGINLLF